MYSKQALKEVEHIIEEWLRTGIIKRAGNVPHYSNIVIVQKKKIGDEKPQLHVCPWEVQANATHMCSCKLMFASLMYATCE